MESKHYYEVNLQWNSATQGTLSSPVIKNTIEVVTPPEFPKGIKEKWTPEHLFVAAVNSCLMSTFLLVADNSNCHFKQFDCKATGTIEKVDGQFSVTEILLQPHIIIPPTQTESKVLKVLEMSEKACAIAHSIKTKITVEAIVEVGI
ncbi:MAG: osmotically inducible protein OsmC [Flavobacterium sp. BFFFF2]|nr:MAG: osmotically inducible protein OsmC [Flavobacterium sp. BFFFF2]